MDDIEDAADSNSPGQRAAKRLCSTLPARPFIQLLRRRQLFNLLRFERTEDLRAERGWTVTGGSGDRQLVARLRGGVHARVHHIKPLLPMARPGGLITVIRHT